MNRPPDPDNRREAPATRQGTGRRAVRSYVLRQGRMTNGQKKAVKELWPRYGLEPGQFPCKFSDLFGRSAPLVLEIGFGMGQSLAQMAAAEPEKDFIGIEVHLPGVGSLLKQAGEANLNNLRIFHADAVQVLADCIPENCLDRVQIYFPDPWPKRRQQRRRLIQKTLIDQLADRLRAGGILHVATDWEPYAEQVLALLDNHEAFINLSGQGQFAPRPAFRPVTRFEQRGERLGHRVRDLLYQKVE